MAISVLCQLDVGSYHLSWHGIDVGMTDEPIHTGNRVGRDRVVRYNHSFLWAVVACSIILTTSEASHYLWNALLVISMTILIASCFTKLLSSCLHFHLHLYLHLHLHLYLHLLLCNFFIFPSYFFFLAHISRFLPGISLPSLTLLYSIGPSPPSHP